MATKHPFGETKTVIKFENNQINFDEEELGKIFLHPDVKDRKIVLFSIVGSYRRGKSFFMDYCLRFMYASFRSVQNMQNSTQNSWLGEANEPLTGFSWRPGTVRDTTGISFWSDVFLHDPINGDPIAIMLVDTQGLFDPETSSEENMKILSLTTLFSSILVLNVSNIIQEDQLQYLQLATEYATFVKPKIDAKPFQKFIFLIRDWQNVDEYNFGFTGGQQYLDEVLKIKPNQIDDLRNVRTHIRDSFDQLLCCLMPYPGKNVATSSDYDGRWSLMDEDFLNEMKSLIESLLKPENLTVKSIDSIDVKSFELYDLIKGLVQEFSIPGKVPEAKSLYELTTGNFLSKIVADSFEIYKQELKRVKVRIDIELISVLAIFEAVTHFNDTRKMGSTEVIEKYKKILLKKIHDHEIEWRNTMKIHFDQLEEEQRKAQKIADEMKKLQEEENERKKVEDELKRQTEERNREIERQEKELKRRQQEIEEEQRRQREAEEAIQRERERQQQLEAEARRLEEERRRREEESRRIKIHIQEIGVNFSVPKPKCSVM